MKEAELGEAARAGLERILNTKAWGGQKLTRENQDRIGLGVVQGHITVGRVRRRRIEQCWEFCTEGLAKAPQ